MELPTSRLINLIWFKFVEGRTDQEKADIRRDLKTLPTIDPLKQLIRLIPTFEFKPIKPTTRIKRIVASPTPQNVTIPKPKLGTNNGYSPPWYQGEQMAYRNAKKGMVGVQSLPKPK